MNEAHSCPQKQQEGEGDPAYWTLMTQSFSLKSECCVSVCSIAGCHRFPLDTHWIVTFLQARSEVRTGQGRTQKAGQVTIVPVVFAELRPGLRHGDKDDPTLPLPMWARLFHSLPNSFSFGL